MDDVKIWNRTVGKTEEQGVFMYNKVINAHT